LDQQRLGKSKEGGLAMRKPGASKKAKKQRGALLPSTERTKIDQLILSTGNYRSGDQGGFHKLLWLRGSNYASNRHISNRISKSQNQIKIGVFVCEQSSSNSSGALIA
jgi:hypothetical protein